MTSIMDPAGTIAEWCLAQQMVFPPPTPEPHMGCLIADAALQAGVRYKTVVLPRVHRLRDQYPSANTVSGFLDAAASVGMNVLLDWTHPVKVERAWALARKFQEVKIESVDDLARWWESFGAQAVLMNIPGVGPKTAEYIGILAGAPSAVAVDTHMRAFVAELAGMPLPDILVKDVVLRAAALLGIAPNSLDKAIWQHMESRGRAARSESEQPGVPTPVG